MTQTEALKLALEALDLAIAANTFDLERIHAATAAIEAVLEQPEQEYPTDEHGYPIYSNGTYADIVKAHAEFESRFEPESIWIGTGHLREILNGNTLNAYCSPEQDRFTDVQLYTTPQHRTPLTREEIADLRHKHGITSDGRGIKEFTQVVDFVRAIEAAHGIKE